MHLFEGFKRTAPHLPRMARIRYMARHAVDHGIIRGLTLVDQHRVWYCGNLPRLVIKKEYGCGIEIINSNIDMRYVKIDLISFMFLTIED